MTDSKGNILRNGDLVIWFAYKRDVVCLVKETRLVRSLIEIVKDPKKGDSVKGETRHPLNMGLLKITVDKHPEYFL